MCHSDAYRRLLLQLAQFVLKVRCTETINDMEVKNEDRINFIPGVLGAGNSANEWL